MNLFLLRRGARHLPYLPELQGLVSTSGEHHVSCRTDTTEQHPRVVRISNFCDALHTWVRVNHNRIGGVSVRREYLLLMWRPLNGTDLRWCLLRVHACAGVDIPDIDRSVVCSSPGGEKRGLPWTPSYSLRRESDPARK